MQKEVKVGEYTGQQFGNYRLTRLIGRGGFAEVYLGEHVYLKTQAAIKILQARLSQEEQENFYAEARTIAHLQHEHIVRVLEFGLKEGTIPYLVMEYAPNGTLRERFPRGAPTPPERILSPLKQVADALSYAHSEHLIHRDIKPENMLLGAQNEVLLSDFGIALIVKGSHHQNTQEVVGTITYMAPEQLLGQATQASDQYALAVVVYEWLSGKRLFQGTFTEIATQHILTPPKSLREHVPDLSPATDSVVMAALAKDPRQRFESVQAFARALEAAILARQSPNTALSPADANTENRQASANASPFTSELPKEKNRSSSRSFKLALLTLVLLLVAGSVLTYALFRPQLFGSDKQAVLQQEMQDLYSSATRGNPQIEDPLDMESSFSWLAGSLGTCMFKDKALHAAVAPAATCVTEYINLSNFAYQVEMTIQQGTKGAVIFRDDILPNPTGGIYYFTVTTQGEFSLTGHSITYLGGHFSTSDERTLIPLKHSPAIKTGLKQTNLLTVIARDQNIYLYVNRQFVGSAKDQTSLSGTVGFFGQSILNTSSPFDVTFKNMQIWIL